jgi:4-amino-4-deoxy-L-arabinose transferase-like glycosyltransferase
VYALVGDHPQAGRALSALLGVLTVVLLAYLGRTLWSPRVGLLAGAIAAVYPPLVALDASLLSEALFLPLELAFALSVAALARAPDRLRWALAAGALCAVAALTRAVADAWLLIALAVVAAAGPAAGRNEARHRWRAAGAVIAAFVLVLAPWTIRNLDTLHALVPVTTESGYTLAGQYNPVAGTPDAYQAVWRVPQTVPALAARLSALERRPGGADEVRLDASLRSYGLRYLGRHPGHLAVATALDSLRLFDLGPGHGFVTALTYREMAIPASLQTLTTRSAQLVAVLALLAVIAAATGVGGLRIGPWWLWAIPVLTLTLTVPMVGNPLKRAPLDPLLILLTAAGLSAALDAVASRRATRRPRAETLKAT